MRRLILLSEAISFMLALTAGVSPMARSQDQAQKAEGPLAPSGSGRPSGDQNGQNPSQPGQRAFGSVTSVGVDRFEIKKLDGTTQAVLVNDQTSYREGRRENGRDIQLEDLKPGDRVAVMGKTNNNKELTAAMVRRVTEEDMQRFQAAGERMGGEIVSIDGNRIKVRNPFQGGKTVVVNDQTALRKGNQAATLKDLKVGDRIFVLGKQSGNEFIATRIFTGHPEQGEQQKAPDQR